jgi:hypothetical protein
MPTSSNHELTVATRERDSISTTAGQACGDLRMPRFVAEAAAEAAKQNF